MRGFQRVVVVMAVALVAASAMVTAASAGSTSMTTANVKSAGISLKFPSTWTVVTLTKKGLAAAEKAESKTNPQVAAELSKVDLSQFKFYAIDRVEVAGVYSNVNVGLAGGAHGVTLAFFRDQQASQYKAEGSTLVDAKAVKVSGKNAFRSDATVPVTNSDGTITDWSQTQLAIPGATSTTWIEVSSTNDAPGMALIDSVIASVHHI